MQNSDNKPNITLGISSCLMGQKVRYDGGHKRDAYILGTLGQYFSFIPFCPEMAVGLGIPRPTIRVVATEAGERRVVGVRDPSIDVTEALRTSGVTQAAQLVDSIDGYLLKKGSPSCGMERVKVYGPKGIPIDKGSGLFAEQLMAQLPLLPVEEEGRLGDPGLRENFIERVFIHHRWRTEYAPKLTPARLVAFHSEHKYQVMAHNQAGYRRLGRLVAQAGVTPIDELGQAYFAELMTTLRRPATRKGQTNLLQHLAGYLRKDIDSGDRQELAAVIEEYRLGRIPLIVPITLLKHHFRRHPNPYIERQHYLNPYPEELMLRNLI